MKHNWTEEELFIIRRDYKHTRQSQKDIAEQLSAITGERITRWQVRHQLSLMGIMGISRDGRKSWDEKQDAQLRKLMPKYHSSYVAKMMHRGINSVVIRAKRLGISRRTRDGWYTKQDVCEIFGVDARWVQSRIKSEAIHAIKHGGSGLYWHIEEAELKEFIRRYPQELIGKNVDMIQIVDLLAGVKEVTHDAL